MGDAGLCALEHLLPSIKTGYGAVLAVVNGENAAEGFGMTANDAQRIFDAGCDVITSGNHVWEKRDFWAVMDNDTRILRPANYPEPAAGRGFIHIEKNGISFLVINLQGREMISPIDCPFRTFDRILNSLPPTPLILVDFHAESSAEKEALSFYLDGRAAVVAGTHTHTQTADEKILPLGTAYITDLGFTGVLDSVIGMDKKICIKRAVSSVAYSMECAKGEASIQGIAVQIDLDSGKAVSIERFSRSAILTQP